MGDGFYEAVVSTLAEPTSAGLVAPRRRGRARGSRRRQRVGEPRGDAVEAEQADRAGSVDVRAVGLDRRRGSPRRPRSGGSSSSLRRQSGSGSRSWACRSVSTSPGKTVVTETPVPESSWRSASAKPRSAALVAP